MNLNRINTWTFYYQIILQLFFLITLGKGEQNHVMQEVQKSGLLPSVPSLSPANVDLEYLQIPNPTSGIDAGAGADFEIMNKNSTAFKNETRISPVYLNTKSKKLERLRTAGLSKRKLVENSTVAKNSTESNSASDSGFTDLQLVSPVKFKKQSPFKGITDLIKYGMKKDYFESRTGLMLFAGITALEILMASTLFFGTTGALVAGLVLMVKMMAASSILMIG